MAPIRWRHRHPWHVMARARAGRFRPRVECLEDRNLLTQVPVNPMLFGLNQPWVDGNTYLDPTTSRGQATRGAVAQLGVQAVRYPGGTVSTYWDWQTGDYVDDAEMHAFPQVNQDGRKQAFEGRGMAGPDGYYAPLAFNDFSQEVGAQTVWVPNLATGDDGSTPAIVAHAADLFNFLSDNGVGVNYVEMGNEYDLGSFASRFPTSQNYIRNHVNPVAATVRQLYPDAAIGVAGLQSGPIWGPPAQYAQAVSQLASRERTWDSGLAANRNYGGLSNFDAVVYHNYRMNASALPIDSGTNNNNWEEALLAFPEASLINAAANAQSVFGAGIQLWLTEFGINHSNLTGNDPRTLWLQNTVTTDSVWDALFTAGFYLTGIQHNDVYQVLMHHDFEQMVKLAGTPDQSYAEIDPTAQVLAHLFSVASQSTTMDNLTLPNNPLLPVSVMGDQLRVLQGVDFQSPGTETLVILNRGNANRNITLPNDGGYTHLERWVYRADATVVPGNFAPIPDSPPPWVDNGPMSVMHTQTSLDPNVPVTFPEHGYALEFVTLSNPASAVLGSGQADRGRTPYPYGLDPTSSAGFPSHGLADGAGLRPESSRRSGETNSTPAAQVEVPATLAAPQSSQPHVPELVPGTGEEATAAGEDSESAFAVF